MYEISQDAASVDTPYTTLISMLNYKPVDIGYPIIYEKNHEVSAHVSN